MTQWKGESRKVRSKTLASVNARMKKRVGESDLGRLTEHAAREARSRIGGRRTPDNYGAVSLYAEALGVTLFEAGARIAAQHARLAEQGEPFVPLSRI